MSRHPQGAAPSGATDETAETLAPMAGVIAGMRRDLRLAWRTKSELAQALAFFVVVASLFPLAVGPESALLKRIAPGIVWVCALLACLLTLPRLFAADYHDGTLEQIALARHPLPELVAGKMLAHWITTGLPLALVAPGLSMQYGLAGNELGVVTASLLLGTPVLTMLGAVGGALVLGVRGGSVLMALLVLPLYIPVLIFGAGAIEASLAGMESSAHFSVLAALLLLAAVGTPFAVAAAIRISLD